MVGKATPDQGGPRKSPNGVEPKTSGWESKRTRKTQRDGHNSGVKIWSLCSVSAPSHMLTFRTLTNKVRGNYVVKEVFLCLPSCIFIMCCLFMRLSLMLCRCDAEWWCRWLYNNRIFHLFLKTFSNNIKFHHEKKITSMYHLLNIRGNHLTSEKCKKLQTGNYMINKFSQSH